MTTTVQICDEPYITAVVEHDGTTDYEVTITLSHSDVERHLKTVKDGMRHSDAFATDVLRATIEQSLEEQLTRHGEMYRDLFGEADGTEERHEGEFITLADAKKWIEEQKRLLSLED